MTITVYGIPAPQGSKKFMGIKGGRGILVESSKAVKPWREAVKWAAIEAMRDGIGRDGCCTITGAISVRMCFTMPKPKSASKTRHTFPDRKPDLSKLVRSTEDALTDAGVWEDDARVVNCEATKLYPGDGYLALDRPGAVIEIEAAK